MKKVILFSLLVLSYSVSFSQRIISKTLLKTFTTHDLDSVITVNVGSDPFSLQYDI